MENYDNLIEELGQPKSPTVSKEEFAAKMKAERDGVSELASNTGTEIAGDGGKFQEYLKVLSRFERYSPQNTLLIFAQRPNATKLGDYDHWKDAGTPVTKGQTGFYIFEPGKEYKREDGTVGTSMNLKKMFDISQTSAKAKLPTEQNHDIRTLLKAIMGNSPVPIKLVDSLSDGVGARYDEQRNVIEVVRGLDGVSLLRCMSQEIAYAQLDHQNTETLTCNDKAFASYAASYAICEKYGIDTKGYEFSNVPEYFEGRGGKEIRGEIKAIRDTVSDVAGRMAKELNPPHRGERKQEERS